MIGLIAWVVLGLIAGAIAKAIFPGHQGGGFLATMLLGIVGALVGGWLGSYIFPGSTGAAAASNRRSDTRRYHICNNRRHHCTVRVELACKSHNGVMGETSADLHISCNSSGSVPGGVLL